MDYQIVKGKIVCKDGIPYLPRWFCDDRIAFECDAYGVSKVEYFNRTTKGSEKVFVDDMWGGLRFYLVREGRHYALALSECEIMPYGVDATWTFGENVLHYQLRALNDSVVLTVTPEKLMQELSLCAEFYDNWRMRPRHDGDTRYVSAVERTWDEWQCENAVLTCGYSENGARTDIAFRANGRCTYLARTIGFPKHILQTDALSEQEQYRFVMSFDTSHALALERADETVRRFAEFSEQQARRYACVQEKMPILQSPYPRLNDFFALAPLYHESCKVLSLPGAVRAKTEHYWVWGWDGMSSSFAYAYWGETEHICEVLDMYQRTADPEKGIGHWFARDMSHIQTSMLPAQGFYISLLYQLFLNGGDISPYYSFAKHIFDLMAQTESGNTGLLKGYSLVPDFRETILETGNDLSTFNNSSAYCAIRAMAELAKHIHDAPTQEKATALADRARESFIKYLFDAEKGTFVASAEADTLEQRKIYMSPAIKWDNLYCMDLIAQKRHELLSFYEKNYVCDAGLMYTPVWDMGFDADANQLHCYWPSNGECYTRLTNLENRRDLIDQWIDWITCWTDILMCPEGIDCYNDVNKPKPDGWNAVNGTWQSYSMRAWYEAVVHSVVGIDFASDGMHIYPYDGEPMRLLNLHFAGKTFDIDMCGSGVQIEDVIVNGSSLGQVHTIPFVSFAQKNSVKIVRR